ncbi:MAG: ribose transport system substrate-binding protein [Acidimicrobiaceae bacterium]
MNSIKVWPGRKDRHSRLLLSAPVVSVVALAAVVTTACSTSSKPSATTSNPPVSTAATSSSTSAPTASYSWSSITPAALQTQLSNVGLGNADYSVYKGKTVGIAELAPIEPVTRIDSDLKKCVKANGGNVTAVDVGGDPTKSKSTMQNFVQQKVAAIYNDALDPLLIDSEIKAANAARIPTITAWSGETAHNVGINGLEFQSAARLAQFMIDRLHGKGTIAMVVSTATASLRARDNALVGILKEWPNIKVVSTVSADVSSPTESGNKVVKGVLAAHPNIDAIWTDFDGIGQGAAQAVKSTSGAHAFVVSFNGDSAALDLIRQPSNPFAATMANDLELTGDVACAEIAMMLSGQNPPAQQIYLDSPIVTKENVPATGFVHGAGPFLLFTGAADQRWPK